MHGGSVERIVQAKLGTVHSTAISPKESSQLVFMSYRRDDSAGHAGRLRADLVQRYGEDKVFMDLAIEPGIDFANAIKEAVAYQIQQAMETEKISKIETARRMKTSRAALDRLLVGRPGHRVT